MLSVLSCDVQESQADHSHVSECQSGICHYHCDHQSKEKTGSRKESLKTDETLRTSVSLYLHPVQCSICYMYFHCVSFRVFQSIIILIILLDSRLKLSRVISLSSVASVVNSVVTFVSRMAAAPQPQAAVNAVNEAAAQVAKSMQSMTVAHIKNEELNNDPQAPVVRHALSQVESTQKDQELQRVMEQVRVNTEPSRDEHLLKCLIKSQMADHPQQWDDHSGDVRYFIGSFKYFQGDFDTLFTVSQGCDRYYIVLSESEYHSWKTYGWIRSPRVSDELSCPQDQVHHAIHTFNRFGAAINHMYYLRVAHSFTFNCHSESAQGRYYVYSGTLRGSRRPWVVRGSKVKFLRLVIDKDSMSFTDEVKYKKVKLHQFFRFHQIWSAETEMFNISRTASSFMTQHVLYHEPVAISNWYLSETILEIMQHPQVRLTQRVIKIIRNSHPHMEALLISGGKFRSSITRLDIDRSFRVVDMRVNPWELKLKESASTSMEVEESSFKRGKGSSGSDGSSAVLTISSDSPLVESCPVIELALVTVKNLKFKASISESALSAVNLTIIVYWAADQLRSTHEATGSHLSVMAWPQRERVKNQAHCRTLPHGSSQEKEAVVKRSESRHVVIVVKVMCLMLTCMQTSKVQIQIHTQIWSSCFRRFLVLVMFTFCGHFVSSFDSFVNFWVSPFVSP